ncbi:ly6/PLAUR domain-containing protein 6-like [Hippocampus comes]|uniref:ly6/PLAUR domain-containing protein 6-like n=1 Tax=Hippocampus comes TaxID=109280 RepID=UPI00094F0FD9|nr:PREDICTED: ly6/PLAUR domain-containing protein 6-like [Hippocampus comes]
MCPPDTRYYFAAHMMDHHGDSVSVTKRCVTAEDCLLTGCADTKKKNCQVCSSCCKGNICNSLVPQNKSAAVFSSATPLVNSDRGRHAVTLIDIVIILISTRLIIGCM